MATFKEAKTVYDNYILDIDKWRRENNLAEIKKYKDLNDKAVMGEVYREAQNYYEKLSSFKQKLFSFKGVFLKIKETSTDRIDSRGIDSVVSNIEEYSKQLDSEMNVIRSRIKFYENIIYMISNLTYGGY